ncbi:hypothetical protein TNCV_3087031 [Trichonephila clavipes]|nr:hypothetical protein TNCV_3087031 [Trichonephila clavipes]
MTRHYLLSYKIAPSHQKLCLYAFVRQRQIRTLIPASPDIKTMAICFMSKGKFISEYYAMPVLAASIAVSNFANLCPSVANDNLLLSMTTIHVHWS